MKTRDDLGRAQGSFRFHLRLSMGLYEPEPALGCGVVRLLTCHRGPGGETQKASAA